MLLETMDANAPGLHDRSRFHDVALFFPVSVERLGMDERYQAFSKQGIQNIDKDAKGTRIVSRWS